MLLSSSTLNPLQSLPVEQLTALPWHDVARWNAGRQRWLARGALGGALLALMALGFGVPALPGDAAYRLACAVSLLLPGAAWAALCAHLSTRLYELRVPHPLEGLL